MASSRQRGRQVTRQRQRQRGRQVTRQRGRTRQRQRQMK